MFSSLISQTYCVPLHPFYYSRHLTCPPCRYLCRCAILSSPSKRFIHQASCPLSVAHRFVSAASGHGTHRQYHFEPSPHFVQTPRQIFLRGMRLPVRLVARFGCARSFLFLPIGFLTLSIHRGDVISDNRISPDRLFWSHPVACRATRSLISIGERRARRTWPLRT